MLEIHLRASAFRQGSQISLSNLTITVLEDGIRELAIQLLDALHRAKSVEIVQLDALLEEQAWRLFRERADLPTGSERQMLHRIDPFVRLRGDGDHFEV